MVNKQPKKESLNLKIIHISWNNELEGPETDNLENPMDEFKKLEGLS